jgi:hypothetical protein
MSDTPNTRALAAASWLRNRAHEHIAIGLEMAADCNLHPSEVEAILMKAHNCLNAAEAFEWDAANGD